MRSSGERSHQAQRLARAVVGKHLQKRRLLQRHRQRDLQRAVEHRLAGGVFEVGQDDRVLLGQRAGARRDEERGGHGQDAHDRGQRRSRDPPRRTRPAVRRSGPRASGVADWCRPPAGSPPSRTPRPGDHADRRESACMITRSSCGSTFGDQRRGPRRRIGAPRIDRRPSDPVSSSYSTRPERVDVGPLRQRRARARAVRAPCSAGVPVRSVKAAHRSLEMAIPKSVIRTSPSSSMSTFAGLRSRCSTPCACAAARPAHS